MTALGWVIAVLILTGQFLLGKKKRAGWVFRWLGTCLCVVWGVMAGQWWIVVVNAAMLGIDVKGFVQWGEG